MGVAVVDRMVCPTIGGRMDLFLFAETKMIHRHRLNLKLSQTTSETNINQSEKEETTFNQQDCTLLSMNKLFPAQ